MSENAITRRSFVAAAATTAAATVTTPLTAQALENGKLDHTSLDAKWAFEIAPEPIAADLISATYEADVVVVGAGLGGVVTAVAAAEQGASVIVVAASSRPVGRGGSNFAFNTKAQAERGISYTEEEVRNIFKMQQIASSYYIDTKKWADVFNYSSESMDWACEKYGSRGLKTSLELAYNDPDNGLLSMPPMAHNFFTDEQPLGGMTGAPLQAKAMADILVEELGGQCFFNTVVKQLVRGGVPNGTEGHVEGCIAQAADGSYVRFNAAKAVVLATGDFSLDRDMMAKYAPYAYEQYKEFIEWDREIDYDIEANWKGLYRGDGHKMALWVGAAWQKTFPCPQMGCDGVGGPVRSLMTNFPGINLNANGERFINELTIWPYAGANIQRQPKKIAFGIWDNDYADTQDSWDYFGVVVDHVNGFMPRNPDELRASWDADVEKGKYFKADTLDELLDILVEQGLDDKEAALASIERYNQYCEVGVDEEFHKNPCELYPIKNGPFYASMTLAWKIRTICGGIRTNSEMQALEADDTPIPGLYTTGIMVGDFYGNIYNFYMPGINLGGVCTTLSYLLGRRIAAL